MPEADQNRDIVLANGERIQLKCFFDQFYASFSLFAHHFVADKLVCEDIVQDVFISLWRKKHHFRDLDSLKAFFYASVRNACLDYLKHDRVKQKYIRYKLNNSEESNSFLDEIVRLETYNLVYREIKKLPEMEEKVLLLALEEKTNEEIAAALGISVNTVRTHKARAYKVLRNSLGDIFLFVFTRNKSFTDLVLQKKGNI